MTYSQLFLFIGGNDIQFRMLNFIEIVYWRNAAWTIFYHFWPKWILRVFGYSMAKAARYDMLPLEITWIIWASSVLRMAKNKYFFFWKYYF